MKLAQNFNANNNKIISLTRGSAAGDAATFDQNAMTPNGGTLAITGSFSVSSKTTTSTFQVTTGAALNAVLQSDGSGNASWTAATASTGGWVADTFGYHAPGTTGQIGIGANTLQSAQVNIIGTVALVASTSSQALRVASTVTPDTAQSGYGVDTTITVNAGTGLTVAGAYGQIIQTITKTGTGVITSSYGLDIQLSTVGGTNNYGLYIDGLTGNGTGTISQVIKLGSSQTGDMFQTLANNGTVLSNINQFGGYGIGAQNTFSFVELYLAGTYTGVTSAGNVISLYVAPTLTTNPGSGAYGIFVSPAVTVASGTTSLYYGIYINPATKTGAGTFANSYGIFANASTFGTTNYAGWFAGNVNITGALTKGSGTFLIDHPLEPENYDLYHGFIEGPRYDLVYRGKVTLKNGRATVAIDKDSVDKDAQPMREGTFTALTQNAEVTSLQNQTGFARVRPEGPIKNGKFTIICEDNNSDDEIVWVVIAERNDPYVRSNLDPRTDNNGHLILEQERPDITQAEIDDYTRTEIQETECHESREDKIEEVSLPYIRAKGMYLYPELYGGKPLSKKKITKTKIIPRDIISK